MASKLQDQKISHIAGKLYSADLIGSALGILIISAYLLPLFGIINVCFFIGGLNFIAILIVFLRSYKTKSYGHI